MGMDYKDYVDGKLLNGRYLKVNDISEGSFGIVSLAKDVKNNDRLVALKYNSTNISDFTTFSHQEEQTISKSVVLRETQREIDMLKRVSKHPNITDLLDCFDSYLVLEYASRGDLHDSIEMGVAPASTPDVVDVFMQLLSAVEYCHSMGVYHRDIKPENILICEDWSIKLTDFGLATDKKYCTDFDVGSERYMAPELLDHKDIDTYSADKVDIWSLGICLLNIVFGKSPFNSASSSDRLFLHFAANRETLFDIFPSMSFDLFSVLRSSLTIDPNNRDLESMKNSLLKVEHLTCDFEFEEDEPAAIEEKPTEEESLSNRGSDKENEKEPVKLEKELSLPRPKHKLGQPRKPIRIPSLRNMATRSHNGRINKRVTIQSNANGNGTDDSFKRADFFTPKTVFNHYMERAQKPKQHAKEFGSEANRFYRHNPNKKNRAWKKRKPRNYGKDNHRSRRAPYKSRGGSNNTRKGNKSIGKTPVTPSSHGDNFGSSVHSSGGVRPRSFVSNSGKYIPPNLRPSPKVELEERVFESEDEKNSGDDDLFLFEDVEQKSKKVGGGVLRYAEAKKEMNTTYPSLLNGQVNALSRQLGDMSFGESAEYQNSRDTSITTTFSSNFSSFGSNLTSTTTYDKYVPPHHRRNSHSSVMQTGPPSKKPENSKYIHTHSAGSKPIRVMTPIISTSVPTKKTNWFQNHHNFESKGNFYNMENENEIQFLFEDQDTDYDFGSIGFARGTGLKTDGHVEVYEINDASQPTS
ncbi:hypothetical protein OGAPHI_005502 [Ogataea philodendri]|uniref:Protein kinase domain-containing protein n=1 Tax=Ogataea philodendri TaxID=1378263 RepID=A0A9P8T1L5_9ASCO|nr:uncharacterized protein OGAPHI_005502 [Ogataea philodendri]KAH3662254.1 hypothetical protein OGAPHI_005502 [Ogataea philodendri]